MFRVSHTCLNWLPGTLLASALTLSAWAVPAEAQPSDDTLKVQDVELRHVTFEEPVRVGKGRDAVYYDSSLEIRLQVESYLEGDQEPALWIGQHELRGHRTQRGKGGYTLAFDAFAPSTLEDGSCIQLGSAPQETGECTFTLDLESATAGRPLVDDRITAVGGTPDPHQWDTVGLVGQCSVTDDVIGPPVYHDVAYALYDSQDRHIDQIQAGDTVAIELWNLPVRRQVQLHVVDDAGQEWAFARLSADREGRIAPTVFWFNTGVIGTTSRQLEYRPDPAFTTFDEAFDYWSGHQAFLELRTDEGELIARHDLPIVAERSEPLLYPSNADGVLMNSMNVEGDRFYVTGRGYPAGSTVALFVVDNRFGWNEGDLFLDRSGEGGASEVTVVELNAGQTDFTVEAWPAHRMLRGQYDLISRVVSGSVDVAELNGQPQTFTQNDVASFGTDTAAVVFEIINGHIVMEIAGRPLNNLTNSSQTSWFEFADVFERGEDIYGAVDPTDFPPFHTGGEYAAYYVVEAQNAAYWDATNPTLVDISGPGGTSQPEVALVKYSCINLTRTPIWPNADPSSASCENDYQVIVDFGSTPATSSGDYTADNTYNKGLDFIDRYPERGFTVIDEASSCCQYGVGRQDHYNDVTAGTNPNRAFDLGTLGFPLVRNWFTIRYPAAGAGGVGAPLPPGSDRYPVVLFLHGRHATCASGGFFNPNCPAADRIPSHRGYDYMLDALAKRGYIAISVDAYDIQPSNGINNYEARGVLILEHLNRMDDWDQSGTDPWSGMFQSRIDLSRVALVGHSRGGEGVVAAQEINVTQSGTYGHGIEAVIAIAPTDQQSGFNWNMVHAPYLGLIGAADGDVWNFQGFGPYDRAYPTNATTQSEKSLAWVYGANHNFWNTIWTPSLSTDPYASDDGASITGPRLTEAEQQQTGLTPVAAFVAQHLLGLDPYRQVVTGKLRPAALRNDAMHWSYQHPDRLTLDDYENLNVALNTQGGAVTYPGSLGVSEGTLFDACWYHPFSNDVAEVTWMNSGDTYVSEVPSAQQDVSQYSHLAFRVAQLPDNGALNPVGQDQNVVVRLVDTQGDQKWAYSLDFRNIPYPYERSLSNRPCQMKTVRIPLRTFTMNNSDVDLDNIDRVEMIFNNTGVVAIDDVHFTQ